MYKNNNLKKCVQKIHTCIVSISVTIARDVIMIMIMYNIIVIADVYDIA